jgi:hypothetical protein
LEDARVADVDLERVVRRDREPEREEDGGLHGCTFTSQIW